MPYIEYNLFRDYIVANLCEQRDEVDNCCQGKCFLEKQINLANETDHPSSHTTGKKQIKGTDDYIVKETLPQKPNPCIETQLSFLTDARIRKISIEIPVPPPKRFI